MAHRILDAGGGALRDTEQREPLEPRGIDDTFEIRHRRVEREIRGISVRRSATARVIADEAVMRPEESKPVPPDGALPVIFDMGQPIGSLEENRTGARRRVGELDAIGRGHEPDGLFHD
jgi:hypothetical protein